MAKFMVHSPSSIQGVSAQDKGSSFRPLDIRLGCNEYRSNPLTASYHDGLVGQELLPLPPFNEHTWSEWSFGTQQMFQGPEKIVGPSPYARLQ